MQTLLQNLSVHADTTTKLVSSFMWPGQYVFASLNQSISDMSVERPNMRSKLSRALLQRLQLLLFAINNPLTNQWVKAIHVQFISQSYSLRRKTMPWPRQTLHQHQDKLGLCFSHVVCCRQLQAISWTIQSCADEWVDDERESGVKQCCYQLLLNIRSSVSLLCDVVSFYTFTT